jgi:hypothetical protein
MSYKYTVTYTKTEESPANSFNTMPILTVEYLQNVTQEQLNLLQNTYPMQWRRFDVENQLIFEYTYASEADYNAMLNDPIVQDLRARRTSWAELNKITVTTRVL